MVAVSVIRTVKTANQRLVLLESMVPLLSMQTPHRIGGFLAKGRFPREFDLCRRTSDKDVEITRSDCPRVIRDVVIGKGSPIQRNLNVPGLAGIEFQLCESLQFLHRAGDLRMPVTNVHLCDLRAGSSAGMAQIEGQRNWRITRGGRNRQVVVGK